MTDFGKILNENVKTRRNTCNYAKVFILIQANVYLYYNDIVMRFLTKYYTV